MLPNNVNKKHNIKSIILSLIIIIAISTVSVVVLYFWHKNTSIEQVKDKLNNIYTVMAKTHTEGNGYTVAVLSSGLSDANVKITGGGSFDGTEYCITGISSSDKLIVFHIDSNNPGTIESGACSEIATAQIPSEPGGLAIAFATVSAIKLTWNASLYATSYKLQCAVDDRFTTDILNKDTTGTCENLKPNTTYHCRVKAVNKKGDSPWSASISITTLAG